MLVRMASVLKKREGDKITPKGRYKLIKIFYKKRQLNEIRTKIPKIEIKKNFAWCTDSNNKSYNSLINKPIGCEYEDLFREDNLYDIMIVLDFNYTSPIKYKGSAIFLHCSENETKFTEGCIAMKKKDLLKLIPRITLSCNLIIS